MRRPFPFHSNAVWPPPLLVGAFILLYGLVAAGLWLIELAAPNSGEAMFDLREILRMRTALLAGVAGVYGAYRLCRFHPACHPAYAAWLKLSPWTADKPLPLGPIHPVWQDAVVIGALTALAVWHAHAPPVLPGAAFGLVYLCGMTLLLAHTRQWWPCLALGFLWPALILPGVAGAPTIALVATMVAVIWHAHRNSLQALPGEFLASSNRPPDSIWQMEIRIGGLSGSSPRKASSMLGWPYLTLAPKFQCASFSTVASICFSALIGWWSFCLMERFKTAPPPELILMFALSGAILRLAIYCSGVAPSFNLWGRLVSGRLVVPGFDQVFLTPVAALMLASVGGVIIRRSGSWQEVAESCVLAAIAHLLLSGGPRLRNWVLTGQHRFRPPARLQADQQRLRSV